MATSPVNLKAHKLNVHNINPFAIEPDESKNLNPKISTRNEDANQIKTSIIIVRALKQITSQMIKLKEEITNIRESSIIVNKEVFNLSKLTTINEINKNTDERINEISNKVDNIVKTLERQTKLNEVEEIDIERHAPEQPQERNLEEEIEVIKFVKPTYEAVSVIVKNSSQNEGNYSDIVSIPTDAVKYTRKGSESRNPRTRPPRTKSIFTQTSSTSYSRGKGTSTVYCPPESNCPIYQWQEQQWRRQPKYYRRNYKEYQGKKDQHQRLYEHPGKY